MQLAHGVRPGRRGHAARALQRRWGRPAATSGPDDRQGSISRCISPTNASHLSVHSLPAARPHRRRHTADVCGLGCAGGGRSCILQRSRQRPAESSPEMAFAMRCNIRKSDRATRYRRRGKRHCRPGPTTKRGAGGALTRERLLNEMGDTCTTPSQAGSNRKGIETCMRCESTCRWMDREVRRNSSENKYVFGEFSTGVAEAYALPCGAAPRARRRHHRPGGRYSGAPWHMHGSVLSRCCGGSTLPSPARRCGDRRHRRGDRGPLAGPLVPGGAAAPRGRRPPRRAAGVRAAARRIALLPAELAPRRRQPDPYTAFVSTFL